MDFSLSHIQPLDLLQTRRKREELQSIGVTVCHVEKLLVMCTGDEFSDVTSATAHGPSG